MTKNGTNGHTAQAVTGLDIHEMMPHSEEAEKAVLGGLLINPDSYFEVSDELHHTHFYSRLNGEIYRAISDLLKAGLVVDFVTVHEMCKSRDVKPAKDTIEGYMADLITAVPNALYTNHYARIVHSLHVRRALIRSAQKVAGMAYDESMAIDAIISQSEQSILQVSNSQLIQGVESVRAVMSGVYDTTMARIENGGQFTGIPSGITPIDAILRGFKRQRLYILAARPGMGKSALSNQIVLNMCRNFGKRGAIFNLEMSSEEVGQRLVASEASLGLTKVEEGNMNQQEAQRFSEAIGRLSDMRLHIDDTPSLTMTQLRAKCRRIQIEHGLDFVVVDYLQLMTGEKAGNNRTQEIGEISRGLKRLAKELDAPVLALAQLSRSLESRPEKRPLLSDLRESGDIENDADCVMFLYRDEYYTKADTMFPNEAELGIAKHRNGPLGIAKFKFFGDVMQFRAL